jgi:CHAT domain-containing protein/Tfp pilus assembly protein PilF
MIKLIKRWSSFLILIFTFSISNLLLGQQISPTDSLAAMELLDRGKNLLRMNACDSAIVVLDSHQEIYVAAQATNHEDALYGLFLKASCLNQTGRFDKAIELGEIVLKARKAILKPVSSDIAKSHNNLGISYRAIKKYRMALYHHRQALIIRKQLYKENDSQITKSLGNICNVFLDSMEFDSALLYKEQVLNIYKEKFQEDDPRIALQYSGLGLIYARMGRNDTALSIYLKGYELLLQSSNPDYRGSDQFLNNIGALYDEIGEHKLALKFHYDALEAREKIYGKTHYRTGLSKLNIGFTLINSGEYGRAETYLKQSLDILTKKLNSTDYRIGFNYNFLGLYYYYTGRYTMAESYFLKSLRIKLKSYGEEHEEVALTYHNLALCYTATGQILEALAANQKALNIRSNNISEQNNGNLGESYFNNGHILMRSKEYRQAISELYKAVDVFKNITPVPPQLPVCYNNLGITFLKSGSIDSASWYLQKALYLMKEEFNYTNSKLNNTYRELANCYRFQKNYFQADSMLNLAFQSIGYSQNSFREVPKEEYLRLLKTVGDFFLLNKARYESTGDIKYLERSDLYLSNLLGKESLGAIQKLIDNKGEYIEEVRRVTYYQFMNCQLRYEAGLVADNRECFKYSELSRSILLYQHLIEAEVIDQFQIPDTILHKEHRLKLDIAFYEGRLIEQSSGNSDSYISTSLDYADILFDLRNQLNEILVQVKEDTTHQLLSSSNDFKVITIKEIQANLDIDETVLEYLHQDDNTYAMIIQKDTFHIHELTSHESLQAQIEIMIQQGILFYSQTGGRSERIQEEEAINNYVNAATKLYEILIRPLESELTSKLIIVPDNIIGYIPFEALLSNRPENIKDFIKYPYLLYDFQVSYAYSATLLYQLEKPEYSISQKKSVLALAPFDTLNTEESHVLPRSSKQSSLLSASSYDALPFSGDEVSAIAQLTNGDVLYGTDASLTFFRNHATDYRVLHLSTHGRADTRLGDYGYVGLSSTTEGEIDKLYSREIYNYYLDSDMIVLSACETGVGKHLSGEGIISLSRAFTYAGAKSIFPTLWQVQDESTKELIVSFYKNLGQGMDKNEALWQAKLSFIETNRAMPGSEKVHPFFWAGLIGIGDMSPINFD